MILLALERSQGNVSGAARLLKITRRSLQYRLDKIREEEAEPRSPEGRND